ncbi:MAG: 3'-5' exonuclease [Lentisphaeraceae bacterium]|nr:3'-5' exonuclease [Lentisphaeraceae bacterium]
MTFYCIDFESTGALNGQEPLEFAWVEINKQGVIGKHREIGFSAVSGGRDLSDIKEKIPHLRDMWPELRSDLQGKVLVGHNVNYDYSLIHKTFPGFKHSGLIDTLTIYRQLYGKQVTDYSLEYLLMIFQLKEKLAELKLNEHFEPHRALYDAYGCALLLQRLLTDEQTKTLFDVDVQGKLL